MGGAAGLGAKSEVGAVGHARLPTTSGLAQWPKTGAGTPWPLREAGQFALTTEHRGNAIGPIAVEEPWEA